jgi:hypothetical protein
MADGLVELSRGSWDAQVQLSPSEVEPLLREYSTWVPSPERDLVFFTATAEGLASYGRG